MLLFQLEVGCNAMRVRHQMSVMSKAYCARAFVVDWKLDRVVPDLQMMRQVWGRVDRKMKSMMVWMQMQQTEMSRTRRSTVYTVQY